MDPRGLHRFHVARLGFSPVVVLAVHVGERQVGQLHPEEPTRVSYVTECLAKYADDPVIASTDYMKSFADQIRAFVPGTYRVLGTDGFGRSDYRRKLRNHFEVDRHYVVVAALKALADENKIPSKTVTDAIRKYGLDTERPSPARI